MDYDYAQEPGYFGTDQQFNTPGILLAKAAILAGGALASGIRGWRWGNPGIRYAR